VGGTEVRAAIVAAGARLAAAGLVGGTAGNLSARLGELIAITPSGVACGALRPEMIGLVGLDGSAVDTPLAPSSELPLHLAAYATTSAGAVVHTHSVAAAAASTLCDALPAVHYYLAAFGPGGVPVVPYAPFGSQELADGVAAALCSSTGALLANHGAVTIGPDLPAAVEAATELEWLCEVYLRAAAAGSPRVMAAEQLAAARLALGRYRAGRPI